MGDGREGHIARLRRVVGNELLLVPAVAVCLYDDNGRVLLGHHSQVGVWSTPGGAVEPGEAPARAAVREAQEELGVVVEPYALVGVFGADVVTYPNGDRTAYVTTAFACRSTGTPRPDRVELDEVRWVGTDDLDAAGLAPWLARCLPEILAWFDEQTPRFDPP